jgi:hypothetical protein
MTVMAVYLFTLAPALAAPEGYEEILQRDETIIVGGQKMRIPVTVWLKTRFVTDAAYFDLWADADLSAFQAKAPKIAGRMSRHQTCGDRVRVKSVTLKPTAKDARLCIKVRYEKWQCLKAALPSFSSAGLSFKKNTVAKTRLVRQEAHVCASMWPVVTEGGREVRLKGKVTKNAVSGGNGLFGDLFDVRNKFRSRLRREINRAMANFKLPVPEALKSFDPVVDAAKFRTREDGSLGMVLTMSVKVTSKELPKILTMLTSD